MTNRYIYIFMMPLLLALICISCKKGGTIVPSDTFLKEYGDWAKSPSIEYVFEMPDHGFLLACSGGKTGYVPVMIRTTRHGGLIWKKEFDNDTFPAYYYLKKNDGTFIVNGVYKPYNFYVSHIDTSGNVLSYNTVYHIPNYNFFYSYEIIQTPEGNNVLSHTNGYGTGSSSANYVIRYDNNLHLIDSINMHDYNSLPGKTLTFNVYQEGPTGTYYTWGCRFPHSPWSWSMNTYLYVAKISPPDHWKLTEIDTLDRSGSYTPEWNIVNPDSSLAILSERYDNLSSINSVAVSYIDKNLKLVWHHYYQENGANIGVWEMARCNDGGYIITGEATVGSGSPQPYALRIDENGNKLWSRIFNFSGSITFNAVTQTSDGGFAFSGYTSNFGSGSSNQVILLKTDASGNY